MEDFMKNFSLLLLGSILVFSLGGCSEQDSRQPVEAVTTPSVYTNAYTNLDQAAVLQAMRQYRGLCTVATVNADGTPNIGVFVPGVADANHVMFGWADNATKANFLRDKEAELVYDVVNLGAESKEGRHQGAVLTIVLEEDPAVLDQIKAALPAAYADNFSAFTVGRIVTVDPIG
jgi:hypothetical protein